MNRFLITTGIAALMATAASAGTVTYDTVGTFLSCGAASSCVQNTLTQVTLGGSLVINYISSSGLNVVTPSFINLGDIVTSGTGSALLTNGLKLTIQVNSNPPGAAGFISGGAISGTISSNNSGAQLTFGPANTITTFGTLPGTYIGTTVIYQVTNTTLALQAPTVGNPLGQTTIQGAVTQTGTPEPSTMLMLSSGLVAVYFGRKRLS